MGEKLSARRRFVRNLVGVALVAMLGFASHRLTLAVIRRDRTGGPPVVAVPELVRITAKTKGDRQPVEFSLMNDGRKPITIRSVSTSCSCVAAGDYAGTILQAGQALKLSFLVTTPEYGVRRTRLAVIHDGGGDPVEMDIEAKGIGKLPVVRYIRNGSPTFLALRTLGDEERITVQTYEPSGAAPWIIGMASDMSAASVDLVDRHDENRPVGGLIEREYTFRVTWKRFPSTSEFRGRVWALTSDRGAAPLPVGMLSGRLAKGRSFSPSVAQLVLGEHPSEIVLFDPGVTWMIPKDARLPGWLDAKWLESGTGQRLVLKLRHTSSAKEGTYKLPLEDGLGNRQMLTVVCTAPLNR